MELVPIKVKIGLKPNGHADYPDWSAVLHADNDRPGKNGGGWHYDKNGHTKDATGSPVGTQYGMLLVSDGFAVAALATFPTLVTKMTEAEAQNFYDNKSCAHMSEFNYDEGVLTGLKAEYDLRVIAGLPTTEISSRIVKAVDPDDVEPGVRRNDQKTWAQFKTKKKISIKTTI